MADPPDGKRPEPQRASSIVEESWDEDTTAAGMGASLAAGQGSHRCLTVMTGPGAGQTFRIPRGTCVIGRAANAELRILDDGVSRLHARLRCDDEDVAIDDLQSRNGTYVNGDRITGAVRLAVGDKVQLGPSTVLRFAHHDELDELFHQSLLSSALRDPLTHLFNKRYLIDRLDSELKFARRHETAVSLLMIDVDHFKVLNDRHGHLAGDAVLAHLATVLQRAVRNEDVVARFGGEELAIILRAVGIEQAVALGERLRRLVEQTVTEHGGTELRATVSVGVASFPSTRAESVEALMEASDQALYRAKHGGRNRVSR